MWFAGGIYFFTGLDVRGGGNEISVKSPLRLVIGAIVFFGGTVLFLLGTRG